MVYIKQIGMADMEVRMDAVGYVKLMGITKGSFCMDMVWLCGAGRLDSLKCVVRLVGHRF